MTEKNLPPQGDRTPRGRRDGSIVPAAVSLSSNDGPAKRRKRSRQEEVRTPSAESCGTKAIEGPAWGDDYRGCLTPIVYLDPPIGARMLKPIEERQVRDSDPMPPWVKEAMKKDGPIPVLTKKEVQEMSRPHKVEILGDTAKGYAAFYPDMEMGKFPSPPPLGYSLFVVHGPPHKYFRKRMKCPKRTMEMPALLSSDEEEEEIESEPETEKGGTHSRQEILDRVMESLRWNPPRNASGGSQPKG